MTPTPNTLSASAEAPTILVVDDTPSNLGMAVDFLEERGYRVSVAQDGGEGLARAALVQPDLILLDVMMPDIDGFEVCRRLKAQPATADIPVIFMTALTDTNHKLAGFQAGGVDYVTKPLQIDEVMARMSTHLKISALQRRLAEQNAELALHRDQLEVLVAERTAALTAANHALSLRSYALNRVGEAAYLIDEQARFLYVNDESCRALGYTRNELLGMTVMDISPDWTAERWTQSWQHIRSVGMRNTETTHRRKDGSIFPVEIHTSYFEYDGCAYDLALARDITERKAAEHHLHTSERKFRTLAENSPDNIMRYDRQHRVVYLNPQIEVTTQRTAAELLGRTTTEINGGIDVVTYDACIASVLASGNETALEVTLPDIGNGPRYHHVRFVAERNDEDAIVGVLAIGRDVTSLVMAKQQAKESRDLLRQLSARRDSVREDERKRIAREIHDELGQMLTAQRLDIATLKLQFGDANSALAERCQHMMNVTDQTIQVVRSIAAALRPAALDMGIVPALEWLAAEFGQRTGIVCRHQIVTPNIAPDEEQAIGMFRIVQESLTNVVRHAEARQVTIVLDSDADTYRLAIRDDGKGFDPEAAHARSFGLVGIRERALMLGGTARIDSAPGCGAAVDIRLPRYRMRGAQP